MTEWKTQTIPQSTRYGYPDDDDQGETMRKEDVTVSRALPANASVALLPCPFCGSPARTDLLPHTGGPGWVQCSSCECHQNMVDTLEEAVARWNTRADASLKSHIEELTKALEEIANRASNLADDDAREWMPSIYSISVKALGDDPLPFLKAVGFDGEPRDWPTRRAALNSQVKPDRG